MSENFYSFAFDRHKESREDLSAPVPIRIPRSVRFISMFPRPKKETRFPVVLARAIAFGDPKHRRKEEWGSGRNAPFSTEYSTHERAKVPMTLTGTHIIIRRDFGSLIVSCVLDTSCCLDSVRRDFDATFQKFLIHNASLNFYPRAHGNRQNVMWLSSRLVHNCPRNDGNGGKVLSYKINYLKLF